MVHWQIVCAVKFDTNHAVGVHSARRERRAEFEAYYIDMSYLQETIMFKSSESCCITILKVGLYRSMYRKTLLFKSLITTDRPGLMHVIMFCTRHCITYIIYLFSYLFKIATIFVP